jgi:LysR family transcriptional regulator, low CO2-responsive transcriptional regulator
MSRAAGELNLTQPAISMQVKQLEEQIGLPLIDQVGKKLVLTEAGEELLRHAREFIARMADLKTAMNQFRGLERGILRIAVVSTVSYFLPRIITEYTKRHPGVRISLQAANRDSVLSALLEKRTDLAVTGRPPENANLVAQRFMDNPLVVIAPPGHKLATLGRIPADLLVEEPIVAREQGSGTRATTERFFFENGMEYRSNCEVSSNEAVKQAVLAGLGLGIVPAQTIELELETKRLAVLPVEGFPIMRHWFLLHRADGRLPRASQAFCDLLLGQSASGSRKLA